MTTLETKIETLADYWFAYSQDPDHADFIEVHDIGIPLAVLLHLGHATATESGVVWIHTDYEDMLNEFGVDTMGEFESLDQIVEIASYE